MGRNSDERLFYLRVEGVNLDNFVYDTDNLSTIRGGGLMLLEVPEQAEKILKTRDDIEIDVISKGASWGLFKCKLKNGKKDLLPYEIRNELHRKFQEHYEEKCEKKIKANNDKYIDTNKTCIFTPKHATIMVEAYRPGLEEGLKSLREKLACKVRWRQMCSPSISFPSVVKNPPEKKVCELDYVRPASVEPDHKIGGRNRSLSASTHARYEYGVWGKSDNWYKQVTGLDIDYLFTHDLGELACNYNSHEHDNLNGKMAVIYLDGNSFGKILSGCNKPEDQRQFDQYLRGQQKETLKAILEEILKDNGAWLNSSCTFFYKGEEGEIHEHEVSKIRFETLLWGGDELIWVAPAWRGWWLLGKFFQMAKGWKFNGKDLTFSAGMVFCNHKAPIYRIKQMLWQLADEAKVAFDRKKNALAYQVIESFDFAGPDLGEFRKRRKPKGLDDKDMLIKGKNMHLVASHFLALKDKIPKRGLYRFVRNMEEPGELDRFNSVLEEELGQNEKKALTKLKGLFKNEKAMWLHILELWDYLVMPVAPRQP